MPQGEVITIDPPAKYFVSQLDGNIAVLISTESSRQFEIPTYVGVHYTRERGHLPPLLIGEVYLVDRVASSAHALVKATRPKGVEGRQKVSFEFCTVLCT